LNQRVLGRRGVTAGVLQQETHRTYNQTRDSLMPATQFNRDSMARWYAKEHLKTDPGIAAVYYLPTNSGDREIRFVEINNLIGDRNDDILEPIDFGIDMGMETEHKLFVLDVTPEQWGRIQSQKLSLPGNWSLKDATQFKNE
jgi:hypothetical protein